MSDETSCPCPRCWPSLHVDECGDIDCTGGCRVSDAEVSDPQGDVS